MKHTRRADRHIGHRRSGMGFVMVEGEDKDILVCPNDFNRAFRRYSKVQVGKHAMPGRRVEGKLLKWERKESEFIGNIQVSKNFAFSVPIQIQPLPDFFYSAR